MKYNFKCWNCKANFRKTTELTTYKTDYGDKQGITCPLCGGMAQAIGTPSILGGKSDNGIAPDIKFMDLDI